MRSAADMDNPLTAPLKMTSVSKRNLQRILPYIPLVVVAFILILNPYYLFPTHGDLDFHLVRAREIIDDPIHGLLWDYMVYYPAGRPLWHQPLIHILMASLWWIGGVRFMHSIMCILQILLTVLTASWVSSKFYGERAGFIAGMLVLAAPRPDTLSVVMPATFVPIFTVLTIYSLSRSKLKLSFITSLMAISTHIMGLLVLPVILADGIKKNRNLIIAISPLIIFWIIYFAVYGPSSSGNLSSGFQGLELVNELSLIPIISGTIGLWFIRKRKEFKPIVAYIAGILILQLYFDVSRALQYVVLPLAITGSYFFNQLINRSPASFKIIILLLVILSSSAFLAPLILIDTSWADMSTPFENRYYPLKEYIDTHTSPDDVVWASGSVADKVAWMTGRRVSNGRYGPPPGFQETFQDVNVYEENRRFVVRDLENRTVDVIDPSDFMQKQKRTINGV